MVLKGGILGGFRWVSKAVHLEVFGEFQRRCTWRFSVGHKGGELGGFRLV